MVYAVSNLKKHAWKFEFQEHASIDQLKNRFFNNGNITYSQADEK
jgi:hypothetical protein